MHADVTKYKYLQLHKIQKRTELFSIGRRMGNLDNFEGFRMFLGKMNRAKRQTIFQTGPWKTVTESAQAWLQCSLSSSEADHEIQVRRGGRAVVFPFLVWS